MERQEQQSTVETVTREDLETGVRNSLGMSLADLEEEARSGRFRSERARMTWFVVSGLGMASAKGPTPHPPL